jgi:hypothetical protein
MGWQTTLNLAKRSKGCYLVTDEILGHIQQGLNGVQVSPLRISSKGQCEWPNETGRNAVPNDVSSPLGSVLHIPSQSQIKAKQPKCPVPQSSSSFLCSE